MARQRNKGTKVFSSISDEHLAVIIARDYNRAPSEFTTTAISDDIQESKSFLHNTSARGIKPMKKWL